MPVVGIGTLPTPFSPASVPLPPETGGRGHTSLRVGGWGESQFRRGAYTVVLFICTYFVKYPIHVHDAKFSTNSNETYYSVDEFQSIFSYACVYLSLQKPSEQIHQAYSRSWPLSRQLFRTAISVQGCESRRQTFSSITGPTFREI
jgi:hypothetical protein